MLIPTKDRKAIYQYLFQEGVMVARKDFNAAKHQDLDVKNLFVIKALQSLNSRGFVRTQFSWQYYYYFLTDEGLNYLREYLHLPAEIVPRTHIKTTKAGEGVREERPRGGFRGDRETGGYRRREEKDGDRPSGDYKPEFVCITLDSTQISRC
jgi:small subunit ribosomal protein S10e